MINLTWSRAWRFAVGPRLERGVRPRCWHAKKRQLEISLTTGMSSEKERPRRLHSREKYAMCALRQNSSDPSPSPSVAAKSAPTLLKRNDLNGECLNDAEGAPSPGGDYAVVAWTRWRPAFSFQAPDRPSCCSLRSGQHQGPEFFRKGFRVAEAEHLVLQTRVINRFLVDLNRVQ